MEAETQTWKLEKYMRYIISTLLLLVPCVILIMTDSKTPILTLGTSAAFGTGVVMCLKKPKKEEVK